jgi:hypothetical protein
LAGVAITNNDWDDPPATGFFDYFYVEEPTNVLKTGTTGWDNNLDENGSPLADPR